MKKMFKIYTMRNWRFAKESYNKLVKLWNGQEGTENSSTWSMRRISYKIQSRVLFSYKIQSRVGCENFGKIKGLILMENFSLTTKMSSVHVS